MPALLDKFDAIIETRSSLPDMPQDPFHIVMDKVLSQTEAVIGGRHTILAGTNNYMGMTFEPEAIDAARKALDQGGTGTTGSRVLNGTYSIHKALEAKLAEFYGMKHAMVFSTGYLANLGMLSTIADKDDYILLDADCHASIFDGCALGQAQIVRFRHNDAADLRKRLRRLPEDAGKLVVVEGVYSMLGDEAPLRPMIDAAHEFGAEILVDEAHSMGVCGSTGRGVAQAQMVEADVDYIVGTFSKSVGTVGGFVVSNQPKFEVLRLVCRPYMFTASLPPSVVASATVAVDIIEKAQEKRAHLWNIAQKLHSGLAALGFELVTDRAESPIVAVKLPSLEAAVGFWSALLEAGVYGNVAGPPATPQGLNIMRLSLSAAHTEAQIDQILMSFSEVGTALGIIQTPSETPLATAMSAQARSPQPVDAVAASR
ncbi:MAG: aminotransferase class I/II-fold pyridoxal phosphate-dependent enzyme [Pseudomonadota bacterium]